MKKKLYWISGILAFLVVIIAVIAFITSVPSYTSMSSSSFNNPQSNQTYKVSNYSATAAGTITVEAMIIAAEYNNQNNPAANWKFVW
ncbi:44164_t:CDS:2 [Gigaspora margarita]|uniref:44164_t:CDS:1 n=1 Tax=Gigaspora margarita TaxID=4874 RepID=A0ABN7UDS2_GIGMA|nr:44164_t:CDS:2 [Gigaspora margarita]